MDHYSILRNAEANRSRIHDDVARQRLAARARAANPDGNRRGPGYRLGVALVQLGTRLQGIAPAGVEPAPMPGVAPGPSEGR
jgi:hypothetical protein